MPGAMHTPLVAALCLSVLMLAVGCAKTHVTPLSQNQARISVDAAPICGMAGADAVALQQAAVTTIRNGFDRFIVTGADGSSYVAGVWRSPTTVTFVGDTAIVSGGQTNPINRNRSAMVILMVSETDPYAEQALDARAILGADWRKAVAKGAPTTC